MFGEVIQVTYELDEQDRRIGHIAVCPPVSETLIQEFAHYTSRFLRHEIVVLDNGTKVLKLTIGNDSEQAPLKQSQLLSEAYGFCHIAELAGSDLDLVKSDEYGVEPSVTGPEKLFFGSTSR